MQEGELQKKSEMGAQTSDHPDPVVDSLSRHGNLDGS